MEPIGSPETSVLNSLTRVLLLLLLLLLTASGYLPGGSGTTIHNTIQYGTIQYTKTHTHSKQYITQKLQTK